MSEQPSDDRLSDPLLRPESAPRDATGRPVRAPLGNSIRTLVVLTLLAAVGVGVWWWRRPHDLTAELGGREWVITDVDGEPATNAAGLASTFVLDGTGEVRGMQECNVAVGTWAYRSQSGRLEISWETQTLLVCPADWPVTYLPEAGEVGLDGGSLSIATDTTEVRAISLADHQPAGPDDLAGTWTTGGQEVEIGRRGLFRVGECRGEWSAAPGETASASAEAEDVVAGLVFDFHDVLPDACDLDPRWRDETPVVPAVHDGVLYLRRDRTMFPLDRDVVRLDPVS